MGTSLVTLVVDDDETSRFLTRRLVHQVHVLGEIVEASNGQQALFWQQQLSASVQPPTPVLVLVDLQMPVLNGWDFLHQQHALPAHVRQMLLTVVVSSSAAAADKQQALALATAYVTKPLTQTVLHQVVQ